MAMHRIFCDLQSNPERKFPMEIAEVTNKKLLRRFIGFPYQLYKNDPNYVPELVISQKKMLSDKNPFFEHSQVKLYLATDKKKVTGRIAAIHNRPHNRLYNENTAFFGLFEVEDSFEVFMSLIGHVIEWARSEGFNRLMGPANFTTNDSCGFLIDGFEKKPVIHMPYNKDYYPDFFERYGFRKAMDLYAYEITAQDLKKHIKEKLLRRIEQKLLLEGIGIRPVRFSEMDSEIMKLREVYNASNADNWGFIPLTEEEFRSMAIDLKSLIPEKLILFAEKDEKVIGFVVALPDFNQVFQHIHSGRLLPAGIFKFFWYKGKINKARILILGVLNGFKNKGIDLLLYKRLQENLGTMGIYQGEAAYVMENNIRMNSILQKIGGRVVKKYRMVCMNL
jgi:GNAT superfamily N-acetyltransferase